MWQAVFWTKSLTDNEMDTAEALLMEMYVPAMTSTTADEEVITSVFEPIPTNHYIASDFVPPSSIVQVIYSSGTTAQASNTGTVSGVTAGTIYHVKVSC